MPVGFYVQRCGAAREGCFPCEAGSRMQILEGGGELVIAAETT